MLCSDGVRVNIGRICLIYSTLQVQFAYAVFQISLFSSSESDCIQ